MSITALGQWKAGVSVFLRASSVVFPVNSVDAHDEGLNVRVGRAAELAAGLSAERRAVAQSEMVERTDSRAMRHHLMQQLLGVGGLLALGLKKSVDALPDQIFPTRSSRGSQRTSFYGDDLPCGVLFGDEGLSDGLRPRNSTGDTDQAALEVVSFLLQGAGHGEALHELVLLPSLLVLRVHFVWRPL